MFTKTALVRAASLALGAAGVAFTAANVDQVVSGADVFSIVWAGLCAAVATFVQPNGPIILATKKADS